MAVTVGTVRKGRSSDGVTSQAGGRREDRDMTKGSQRAETGPPLGMLRWQEEPDMGETEGANVETDPSRHQNRSHCWRQQGSSLKRPQQSWSRLLRPRRGVRGQQIPTSCGSMLEYPKKALARWVGSGQ